MRIPTLRSFSQFVDNMLWRGLVWISHTKINDIFTPRARCCLEPGNFGKDIRGQTLDTSEFFVQFSIPVLTLVDYSVAKYSFKVALLKVLQVTMLRITVNE